MWKCCFSAEKQQSNGWPLLVWSLYVIVLITCFCLCSERVSPPDTITHASARRPTGFNPCSHPDLYYFNVDILWPKSRGNFHSWSSTINGIDDRSKTSIRFHLTQKLASRALPEKQTCFACVLKCPRERSVYLHCTGGRQILHQYCLQYEKRIGTDRCKCSAERSRPCIGLVDIPCTQFLVRSPVAWKDSSG